MRTGDPIPERGRHGNVDDDGGFYARVGPAQTLGRARVAVRGFGQAVRLMTADGGSFKLKSEWVARIDVGLV